MNKKVTITLSVLILLLLLVIAAGVYGLYHGVPDQTAQQCETVISAPDSTEAEKIAAQPIAEPQEQIKPAPVKEPEPKVVTPKVTSVKVKNCATGKLNTLRQNADNSIELINEKGKSLWKRQMPGQWGGAAGEVDYFNNKKIQFLIAVGKNVYLIDRLGRDVQGFPKPIPFEAVNGPVSVKTDDGAMAWKIETKGEVVYLNSKANDIRISQ